MKPSRTLSRLLIAAALLVASQGALAACRAGTAAARGGQAGFDAAKAYADQVRQTEVQSQNILQQCVSGITGTITGPTFPSMQQIFNRMVKQVCYAASSKVNSAIGQINGGIDGIYDKANGAIQDTGAGDVVGNGNLPTTGGTHVGNSGNGAGDTDWWSNIWK